MKKIFDDEVFESFVVESGSEYEFCNCTFKNINFSDTDFHSSEFTECTFRFCNLSMAKFVNTVLNQVKILDCKVFGVDFSKCSKFLFSLSFEKSALKYSLFYKNDLKNTVFKDCDLSEVSFLEVNLTSARFINCEMDKAVFDKSNLEKADFSTSRNYSFNPENNRLKKTKFSMPDVVGLLSHLDIELMN